MPEKKSGPEEDYRLLLLVLSVARAVYGKDTGVFITQNAPDQMGLSIRSPGKDTAHVEYNARSMSTVCSYCMADLRPRFRSIQVLIRQAEARLGEEELMNGADDEEEAV